MAKNSEIPAPPTASSAQTQALSIPEIIKTILLSLPIRDLLVNAQLVSWDWNTLIKTSTSIQQALFFRPLLEPEASNTIPRFNPLLLQAFPLWFVPDPKRHQIANSSHFKELEWNSSDRKSASYSRKEASWRKMLPVQPAVKSLEIVQSLRHRLGGSKERGQCEFEDGIRMGVLYDFGTTTIEKPLSNFALKWNMVHGFGSADDGQPSLAEDISKVTMTTFRYKTCFTLRGDVVAPHFRSEGHEDLDIKFEAI